MQAVVPAAGKGTRLRPLTAEKPKALVEVGDKPLLSYVFDALAAAGIAEVVVVIGYRGDEIVEYFGDSYEEMELTYVTQPVQRGLADALLCAEDAIEGDFLLLNGDNIIRANVDELVSNHRESDVAVTALVEDVPKDMAGKGAVLEYQGERITGIVEKPADPPSSMVPRGSYALSPLIFHACHLITPAHTGEFELTTAINLIITAGHRLNTVPLDGWCYNVNTEEDIRKVERKLSQ